MNPVPAPPAGAARPASPRPLQIVNRLQFVNRQQSVIRLPCALPLALALAVLAVVATAGPSVVRAEPTDKYGGTYRINDWRALESRQIHHFFYLHPDGQFLLAAEWPGNERSQFVGTWSVADDRLYLVGNGSVDTNQGAWRTELQRTYRIRVENEGFVLLPEPVKNRYGLLGWPQAFRFYRRQPSPNLPAMALPADMEAMAAHIAALRAKQK